jgi:hypothetical protein
LKGLREGSKGRETAPVVAKGRDQGAEIAPVGDLSRGAEADLAHALKLAAEAGEWAVVASLSRQLEALMVDRKGGALRVVPGGRR